MNNPSRQTDRSRSFYGVTPWRPFFADRQKSYFSSSQITLALLGLTWVVLGSPLQAQTTTNTVTNGGTINFGVTEIITNTVASPISAPITNNGSLQFWQTTALTVSGAISGSGTLTKASGSGNLTLSGPNTFGGKVTVSSGTLTANSVADSGTSAVGTSNQLELGSNAALQINVPSGTNTTARQLIVNGGFTLANFSNGSLVWNGNLVNNATAASSFLFNSTGTGTNEFAGAIGNSTNGSALNLNFQATQIWKLSGSNTFSGGITIGGGKVIATTIGDTGTASSVGSGGTIRFGYFDNAPTTFEYTGSGSTNNRQIKLGASAGSNNNTAFLLQNGSGALVFTNTTFTLSGDVNTTNVNRRLVLGGTNTMDNAITGTILDNIGGAFSNSTITIVKDGAGKWILGGNNSYTGGTVISNGILQIGNGGTSGSVLGAITNNSTLIFNRTGAFTVSNAISGTGTLTMSNSGGTLTLTGANTYTNITKAAAGTIIVTNSNLSATILPASLAVNFATVPANGTYPILSGPVDSASMANLSVTANGVALSNRIVQFSNSPNLQVVVSTGTPRGITFTDPSSGHSFIGSPSYLAYSGSSVGPQVALDSGTGSANTPSYSYVGVDGTSYGPSSTAPAAVGRYKMTASVATDGQYPSISKDFFYNVGSFSAFKDFWWNGLVKTNVTSPNNLADWMNTSKAAVQGRSAATPTNSNAWSYGSINATGVEDYPTSITGATTGVNSRSAWQQFWNLTTSDTATDYANGPPLWVYKNGAEIGWYGSAWYGDAPGNNGTGAGRNGLSTSANSNTKYLWLKPVNSANDGVAPAVRWTAPLAGTYRFKGEFLPGGSGSGTMSVAILTANNPDLPDDGSASVLKPRTLLNVDGSWEPFDFTLEVVGGQTVTWVVGTDGIATGDVMGLQAEVYQVHPLTITGVTVSTKAYDGKNTATLNGTPVLNGVANGQTVEIVNLVATFNSTAAGVQSVTLTGELTGADSLGYTLPSSILSGTIDKATTTISSAPAASAINAGQFLSDSLLTGGNASVPGAFAFTLPSTAPTVGTSSHSVTFTPTDTANYNTATAMVNVTVNSATPSGASFAGWRGASPASAELLQNYAFGAATPLDTISRSNLPSGSMSNGNLVLTYFVRQEAANADLVVPQLSTNLGNPNSWGALPSNNIATVSTTKVNGVDVVKKTATVPVDATIRKFLRLKIQE